MTTLKVWQFTIRPGGTLRNSWLRCAARFIPRISVLDYEMNSTKPLDKKQYVKYLAAYIEADLSWNHHIEHISGKNK